MKASKWSVYFVFLFILQLGPNYSLFTYAKQLSTQYQITTAFPNLIFDSAVDLQSPDDGSNRIFVVEKAGLIYSFDNYDNISSKSLFLNLTDKVKSDLNEQGLLGLAFHPDFKSNGYFFVDYTAVPDGDTRISRFSTEFLNSNKVNETSEHILLVIEQPEADHNGGQLAFGLDNYLYIGVGDGGTHNDDANHGQNLETLLGSILRLDVDSKNNYTIPADNPFVNNTNQLIREEIYAYGFRNPWRFSFDPVTGDLFAGDVGLDTREEINVITIGNNYGWRIMEGSTCHQPEINCNNTGLTAPIIDYAHEEGQGLFAVTGGYTYRGSSLPNLVGSYIYGDFGQGTIWALVYNQHQVIINTLLIESSWNFKYLPDT